MRFIKDRLTLQIRLTLQTLFDFQISQRISVEDTVKRKQKEKKKKKNFIKQVCT